MKNKGITLVALVITIIILLILAGISISALTNQGLFKQAQNAKNLTEEKTAEENEILTNYLEQMNAILGGQVTESIPDGATVTPINDITTWLKTGGISKQYSYTTIEQVIADTTCTESLMNNENAMKYLARSTEFANAICASETTMTYLGQSTYVDDTVLNSDFAQYDVWYEAIFNSPYRESVLENKVVNASFNRNLDGWSKDGVGGNSPSNYIITTVITDSNYKNYGSAQADGELNDLNVTNLYQNVDLTGCKKIELSFGIVKGRTSSNSKGLIMIDDTDVIYIETLSSTIDSYDFSKVKKLSIELPKSYEGVHKLSFRAQKYSNLGAAVCIAVTDIFVY